MGNTFFCNRCDIEKFNLSRACADQFLFDDKEKQQSEEERWAIKLKCLDDVHSKQKGLTRESFDEIMEKLEKRLNIVTPSFNHNRDILIECLKQHPNCMLNCKRQMDEFIESVDTIRVKKIKEKIQESKKTKRKLDFEKFESE